MIMIDDNEGASSNIGSRRSVKNGSGQQAMSRLLPLLTTMVSPTHGTSLQYIVNYLGLVVEAAQQIAFVVNPHFGFHLPVSRQVAYGAFATHMPVWDPLFSSASYIGFSVWYWMSVIIVLCLFAYMGAGYFDICEMTLLPVALSTVVVVLFNFAATSLSVPIMHALAANMFCHNNHLWAFPDKECWAFETTIYFVISLLCLFALLALCILGVCSLFGDAVGEGNILARAHSTADFIVVVQKICLVLMYHLLLGPGRKVPYAVFVLVLNCIVLGSFAFIMPYYSPAMNSVRCAIHGAAAAGAVIAFFASLEDDSFFDDDCASLLLMTLCPMAAVVGYFAGSARICIECRERMEHLKQFGEVFEHHASFPTGLIANDRTLTERGIGSLESEILEHAGCGGSRQSADESEADDPAVLRKLKRTQVLVPYLDNVVLSSDVEVSTRFLLLHADATATMTGIDSCTVSASPYMVAFAARIFIKALASSAHGNGLVFFHFSNFIKTFCPPSKLVYALEQCEGLLRDDDINLSVRFQAHRVYVLLREHLGIHSKMHKHSLARAKRMHRETLSDMSTFWLKLMDTKHDLMSLAFLTNQITDKRNKGFLEYQRAVQDGSRDREVLNSYASFLEYVMFDKKKAELVQHRVSALGEEMQKQMMGSMRSGASSRRTDVQQLLEASEAEQSMEANNSALSMASATLFVFVTVALTTLVVIGIGTASKIVINDSVDKIVRASEARTFVQIATHQAMLVQEAITSQAAATVHHHQLVLHNLVAKFSAAHTALTFGKESTSYKGIQDLYTKPRFLMEACNGDCAIATGLRGIGLEVLGALTTVSLADVNDTTSSSVLADSRNRDFAYLLTNSDREVARCYNDIIPLFRNENDQDQAWMVAAMVFCLVVSAFTIGTVIILFNHHFKSIGANKIIAIHLFSLIPHPTQKQLHHTSRERIREFARASREADKGTEALDSDALVGLEGGDDEGGDHDSAGDPALPAADAAAALSGSGSNGKPHPPPLAAASTVAAQQGVPAEREPEMPVVENSSEQMESDPKALSSSKRSVLTSSMSARQLRAKEKEKPTSILLTKKKAHERRRKKMTKKVTFDLPDPATDLPEKPHARLVESTPEIQHPESFGLTAEERNELLQDDDKSGSVAHASGDYESRTGPSSPAMETSLILGIVVAVLYTTGCGLTIDVALQFDGAAEKQQRFIELQQILEVVSDKAWLLRRLAQGAVHTGKVTTYWDPYLQGRHSHENVKELREVTRRLEGVPELQRLWQLQDRLSAIEEAESVSLRLVMDAFPGSGLDVSPFSGELKPLSWAEPAVWHAELSRYADYEPGVRNLSYGYATAQADLAQDGAGRLRTGRRILSSGRLFADMHVALRLGGETLSLARVRLQQEASEGLDRVERSCSAGLALFVASAVLLLAVGRTQWKEGPRVVPLVAAVAAVSLVLVGLLAAVHARADNADYGVAEQGRAALNRTKSALQLQSSLLQLHLVQNDSLYYARYFRVHDEDPVGSLTRWVLQQHAGRDGASAPLTGGALTDLQELADAADEYYSVQFVALELMRVLGVGGGLLPPRPEHYRKAWSIEADRERMLGRTTNLPLIALDASQLQPGSSRVPVDDVWYSTTAHDTRNLTAYQQGELARVLVFGTRMAALREAVIKKAEDAVSPIVAAHVSDQEDKKEATLEIVYASAAMCVVGELALAGLLISMVLRTKVKGVSEMAKNSALFSSVVLKCRLAFIVTLCMVCAQVAVGMRGALQYSSDLEKIDHAAQREWAVARAAIASEHLYRAHLKGSLSEAHRARVSELVSEIEAARNKLFIGAALDPIISDENVDRKYISFVNIIKEVTLMGVVRTTDSTATTAASPAPGVAATTPQAAAASARRPPAVVMSDMRKALQPLIDKLWEEGVENKNEITSVC